MAPRNDAIVAGRWARRNGRNEAELLEMAEGFPNSITIADITNQDDGILPPRPNIFLVEISGLTNAQLTGLKANNRFLVLMDRQYDDVTGVEIASTYDDVPSAAQLTTFVNQLKARFDNIDDDKLTNRGRAAFRAGLTRRQIVEELIERWQQFEKG